MIRVATHPAVDGEKGGGMINVRPYLEACVTRQERATWLLRAPLATLLRDEMTIRNHLRTVGFREGLAYLDAELRMLRTDRREDGQAVNYIDIAVARGRMTRIADGLPPVGLADKP